MTQDHSKGPIRRITDLEVYNLAFELAKRIFEITKAFPKEEIYSLTDQIRKSSRSVAINIREGSAKRRYEQVFVRHLNDAFGSAEETRGWLDFALECGYVTPSEHETTDRDYDRFNAMLYNPMNTWRSFEQ